MIEDRHSHTAEGMAAVRCLVSAHPAYRGVLFDPYARHFVVGRYRLLVHALWRFPRLPCKVIDRRNPGAISYIAVRHRRFDDELARAVADGFDEVILLGAGFDSRAYRFADGRVRFTEIDHPATQRVKREVAQAHGFTDQAGVRVRYLPVDFAATSLASALAELPSARALIVWEGVAWYLSEAAVRSTLTALSEWAAPGSRLVFDVIDEDVANGVRDDLIARAHRRYCEGRGEPIDWGIDRRELDTFVSQCGWQLSEVEASSAAAERVLGPGAEVEPPLPFLCFVHAFLPE